MGQSTLSRWYTPLSHGTGGRLPTNCTILFCMFFTIFFLEISSESMATKEAAEINEEAVAPKAPIKEEDAAKALEKEEM